MMWWNRWCSVLSQRKNDSVSLSIWDVMFLVVRNMLYLHEESIRARKRCVKAYTSICWSKWPIVVTTCSSSGEVVWVTRISHGRSRLKVRVCLEILVKSRGKLRKENPVEQVERHLFRKHCSLPQLGEACVSLPWKNRIMVVWVRGFRGTDSEEIRDDKFGVMTKVVEVELSDKEDKLWIIKGWCCNLPKGKILADLTSMKIRLGQVVG